MRDGEDWFHYHGRADDRIKVGGSGAPRSASRPASWSTLRHWRRRSWAARIPHGLVEPEAHMVLSEPLTERVGAEPAADALTAELVRHCQEGLPRYMYPRWIRFVAELPKTATGKIRGFGLTA